MSKQPQTTHFQNTNRWQTRELVTMALMCAVATLFSFIQIPLIPSAPFLSYDPSLVPAMICGFAFGPSSGIAVGGIAAAIHGLATGDWVGTLMNIVATVCFILPAALLHRKMPSFKGAALGLALGVITATLGALAANLTIGVWFWYGSADVILPMLLPAIIPFNLVKTILNSILSMALYRTVSNINAPKKHAKKGK